MESIRKELGEDDASVVDEYRTKIEEAGMPDAVREQADKELGRLERLGEQSAESSVIRTYLDWLIAIPWSKRSEERLDPSHAREVLDADHAGLEDVKDRIVEYIAVKKLRQERELADAKRGRPVPGPEWRGDEDGRGHGSAASRGAPRRGRDPHADRPARDRQDLDRRVDRPRDRT